MSRTQRLSRDESVKQAEIIIPAVVRMFAGCDDAQTSSDVKDVKDFKISIRNSLRNSSKRNRGGGAMTSALLNVLYHDKKDTGQDLTFKQLLFRIRHLLNQKGFTQIPQLSSSRPSNLDEKFTLLPPNFSGRRHAVLIGINYVGDNVGELEGSHNDVRRIKEYIQVCHGFLDDDIVMLMDDGNHTQPTAMNIMRTFQKLAKQTKPGDAVFVHFSGHGVEVPDKNGDEKDGFDEAMVPVDYASGGVILDDTLLEILVCPLPKGSSMTCFIDSCHSGTMLDLPYEFTADGKQEEMELVEDYPFDLVKASLANNVAKEIQHNSQGSVKDNHQKGCGCCIL